MFEKKTHSNFFPKLLVMIGAALIIGMCMAFLSSGLTSNSGVTGKSGEQLEGSAAPNFTAMSTDGFMISLSDYRGFPVILNFWASWCPPCREETPELERVWSQDQHKGIVILGVNVQDSEYDSLKYLEEFGVTFPNVYDEGGRITVDYGVTGLPVTFFIDRHGNIVDRWVGGITYEALNSRSDSLLRGLSFVEGKKNNSEK